jgi:hypothetical protein
MDNQARIAGGRAQASVVRLPAEVEYANAWQAGQELAAGAVTVVADLTPTTVCDTAGVREMLLATGRRQSRASSCGLWCLPG